MSDSVPQLSKILIETVEYIADGKTKQEIADILGLKYNTVMKRVRMCREQTGTVNNASLVAYCFRNGLIK